MANLVTETNYAYDELIGGTYPHVLKGGGIIASGAGALKRGTVLGLITASGKYTVANTANEDGSQVGSAILADDVDATSADVNAEIYISGMFNREKLIFGGEDTYDKQAENLRMHDIYLTTLK